MAEMFKNRCSVSGQKRFTVVDNVPFQKGTKGEIVFKPDEEQ